jgi:hypothetical protein
LNAALHVRADYVVNRPTDRISNRVPVKARRDANCALMHIKAPFPLRKSNDRTSMKQKEWPVLILDGAFVLSPCSLLPRRTDRSRMKIFRGGAALQNVN